MLHKTLRESPNYVEFTIPLHEPLASSYHIRVVSDRWLGCETSVTRGQPNPRRCCHTCAWSTCQTPACRVHVAGPIVPLVARAAVGGAHAYGAPAVTPIAEERGRQSGLGGDMEVLALQCGAGGVMTS